MLPERGNRLLHARDPGLGNRPALPSLRGPSGRRGRRRRFRALIAADKDERFHRHFAELSYALKDSREPDFKGAETALTKAMDIRDRQGVPGYRFYELNRAVCRIQQDPTPDPSRPSEKKTLERILADLHRAAEEPKPAAVLAEDAVILNWLARNDLSVEAVLGEPGGR